MISSGSALFANMISLGSALFANMILSGSALFAKIKTIFRDKGTEIHHFIEILTSNPFKWVMNNSILI